MQRLLLTMSLTALVAGCTAPQSSSASWEQRMRNPLFAERYYAEQIDRLADLQIQNDPLLQDAAMADRVNDEKVQALQKVQVVRDSMRGNPSGQFLTVKEVTEGMALLKDDILYIGTDFIAYPGVDLRVYLTPVIDPRDQKFPDDDSIDLGPLQSPYGAQEYAVTGDGPYHTVVLWDAALNRIIAFAQLN